MAQGSLLSQLPKARKVVEILLFLALLAIVGLLLDLSGIDISGWIEHMLDRVAEVSPGWIVLGLGFQTVPRRSSPVSPGSGSSVRLRASVRAVAAVFASYAVAVALNGVLPAASAVRDADDAAGDRPRRDLPGVFSALLVSQLFFFAIGVILYLYLFIAVEGTFSAKLGRISAHPALFTLIVVGSVLLIGLVLYLVWRKARKLVGAGEGRRGHPVVAAHLPDPRRRPGGVGYLCQLRRHRGLPRRVLASRSRSAALLFLAGSNSVSPAPPRSRRAAWVSTRRSTWRRSTATRAPRRHRLLGRPPVDDDLWNVLFAIGLVVAAFGWSGGPRLVRRAIAQARDHAAEEHASSA